MAKVKYLLRNHIRTIQSPILLYPAYRIWDVNEIWEKMCRASNKIIKEIQQERIAGVTVTTFGVDGTLFDKSGKDALSGHLMAV